MASDAVGLERISKTVGYKITKGDFSTSSPNLPVRIGVFAEANDANQSGLDLNAYEATTAQAAGAKYGYGSPIYNIMRILRPASGEGVGGIPIIIYPQAVAGGATAKVFTATVTGTSTANATHTLVIAGRESLDGSSYDINIVTGDTPTLIAAKIRDAVNACLGAPVLATSALGVVTVTSKWSGLTSNDLRLSIKNNGNTAGITYAIASTTDGSGTPSVSAGLALIGNEWVTHIVNSYGTHTGTMALFEAWNGIPDPDAPTGRFAGIVMKPAVVLTGSTVDDPSSITNPKTDEVTIAICPAPLSDGHPMEAAANACVLSAKQIQNTPHLDISGMSYPDMPTPLYIGSMDVYNNRDIIVKKGCSTVQLVGQKYQVTDFVTTYHKVGEIVPQFRYVRNLFIDFNIRFGYFLLEQTNVVDHAIAKDDDIVSAAKVIKPKQWKSILRNYAIDLASRALIVDANFMKDSTTVNLSTSNPDRLETFFRYKRSGYARISSTTAEAGFNFGTLN
jgi:phage tail sheath gpL-like